MSERLGPRPERAPVDPFQRAIDRFDKIASSPYDPQAMQEALDAVRATGMRVAKSPGEFFTTLVALSGMAVDIAGKQGTEEQQRAFAEQQQTYRERSEQLTPGGLILPTSPSTPQRTTGRASG